MTWALAVTPAVAFKTYALANAAAKCAAVEARYADGILLPTFASIRISDPQLESEAEFPVLYIIPTRDQLFPGPTGLKRGFGRLSEIPMVVVYEATVDLSGNGTTTAEVLAAMGLRYAAVMMELIADSITSTGVEWGTGPPPEVTYGPRFTLPDRTAELSDVQIRIAAAGEESSL